MGYKQWNLAEHNQNLERKKKTLGCGLRLGKLFLLWKINNEKEKTLDKAFQKIHNGSNISNQLANFLKKWQ